MWALSSAKMQANALLLEYNQKKAQEDLSDRLFPPLPALDEACEFLGFGPPAIPVSEAAVRGSQGL